MALVADVAVPAPLGRALSYLVPAELAAAVEPGSRVLCELGRRRVAGIVLEVGERPDEAIGRALKPIAGLLDREPTLPLELLRFLQQLASYYFAPIGEVLRLALPAIGRAELQDLVQQGKLDLGEQPSGIRAVVGRQLLVARATDRLEQPGSLRGQTAAVLATLRAEGELPLRQLERRFGNARNAARRLATLGLVVLESRAEKRPALFVELPERDEPPTLTSAQAAAVESIESALQSSEGPRGLLLFGVTGSGKTEVYLRAIATCLAASRGALVLVPEIALTPQLLGRFRARLGDAVALLHSGLAPSDRLEMWRRLRGGQLRVAIGARSALFAPVPNLGLVVVDEEHDGSFKQEEGVRYHARDMALLRAHRAGAVSVLGSATPSLESFALARRGQLELLRLPERAYQQARLPSVTTIDLRHTGPGPTGNRLLTLPLHLGLEQTLAAGEQAIVFLNRRGFAPSVVCEACGKLVTCKQCSVALTYHHRAGGRVRCHYCDFAAPLPERCPECHAPRLSLEGVGTEKLERVIGEAFPAAKVARLDRDVTPGARSEAVLSRMRAGEIDILVGTQMVTKGHDLPRVTLVGVVNADAALSLPDFRAAERGFQLLVQVAGRAGRHDRQGRVLVQTRDPHHPSIRFAMTHDVERFLEQELKDRREVGYPPFRRLAMVRVDGPAEESARTACARLAAQARSCPQALSRRVEVLGPAAAPIARLRGRYRFRLLLRSTERRELRSVLRAVERGCVEIRDRNVRAIIDVDPVSML